MKKVLREAVAALEQATAEMARLSTRLQAFQTPQAADQVPEPVSEAPRASQRCGTRFAGPITGRTISCMRVLAPGEVCIAPHGKRRTASPLPLKEYESLLIKCSARISEWPGVCGAIRPLQVSKCSKWREHVS